LQNQKARLAIIFVQYRFDIELLQTLKYRLKEKNKLRKIKIDIDWQIINSWADFFILNRYLNIVYVFDKFVDSLFFLAILFDKIKYSDRITIESSFVFFNYQIIAIDSYQSVIVQNRKSKNFSI